ncbi:MAG: Methyltrans SAM protein [Candidatus Rokubacteria bacterium]|nr:Methyltrans SAM protein [Candidatus Rokubacteria bacterium]
MSVLPPAWADALDRRRLCADLTDPSLCTRLLHDEVPRLRCDRYGAVCWFYWYRESSPDEESLSQIDAFTRAAGAAHWHVHGMSNRGRDPSRRRHWASAGAPGEWTVVDGDVRFQLRADRGQSPGLFLDQRRNRNWVRQHSAGARVLNLFAYTGAFGLAAAAGGAAAVAQVDVSRGYLDWARGNAALNGLEGLEYAAVDARRFLEGCRRRGRRFDGVVCDPPSFARGRRGEEVLRVERDLAALVCAGVGVTQPGGWILVSANYRGWRRADFEREVAVGAGAGCTVEAAPGAGVEFSADGGEPALRSAIVRVG